ncbi:hypothetical protein [Candidatus Pelagibacter sp. HIMB1509]|jgi:hypothetical protein|uniref:hypothetical protein n=1 Tax=Candidatus Pelagibacter sp. HIMB1509 TaxID=3413339 RepID=UPI003F84505C
MFKTIPKVNLKEYFQVIEKKKSGYYPFNLQLKEIKRLNGGESKGIYAIFFKDKLVYIGLHHGKGNVVDRWEKHIKSFTSRFLPLNFLSADKTKYPDKKNSEFTKFYKNFTYNKLIDYYQKLQNDNEKIIIEKILSEHIKLKKSELKNKYKNILKKDHEIFIFLNKITFIDDKKVIQLLTNEGSNTTINRLKFCLQNWDEFKKKDNKNILDHFECVYFRYVGDKKISEKILENQVEKKCIKNFKPIANDEFNEENLKNYKQIITSNDQIIKISSFLNNLEIHE